MSAADSKRDSFDQDLTQRDAVERLASLLGPRCEAIYGVGAEDSRGSRSGRGRLLVIVDRIDRVLLDRIVGFVARCQASTIKVRLDTADALLRSTDTFPAYALDLKEHRRLLHGRDVLLDLQVDLHHLRLHVEHNIRGIHRDLVANYLDQDIRGWQIPELRRMARKLVYLMEGLLMCSGCPLPVPPTTKALIEAVHARLLPNTNGEIWNILHAFASNERTLGPDGAPEVYASLFEALPELIDVVDRMASNETPG